MPRPMEDVIVVLPGIMGSTLHRDDVPVWEPSRRGVVEALTSLLRNVRALQLPDGVGDDHPGDGVEPVDLMPDIRLPFGVWTFDLGYDALLRSLRETFALVEATADWPGNLVLFPYDWRLSNRYNGRRLQEAAGTALERWQSQGGRFADAKLILIAHSMGGLVARWYLDRLGGAAVTRKLITLGTPHRGALKALEQLVNGVRKGPGPFKANLTSFAASLPSLHQLLPEYACIDEQGGLRKTTELALPNLTTATVRDAMTFHDEIDAGRKATAARYELHPVCGFKQPTWTSARITGDRLVADHAIDGRDEGGDATVPRIAAVPPDMPLDSAVIQHNADNHGGLVHNQNVFDHLEGVLSATRVRYRGGSIDLTVEVDEVLDYGEPLRIRATPPPGSRVALEVRIASSDRKRAETLRLLRSGDAFAAELPAPNPDVYEVTVRGVGAARHQVVPVTTAVLVWPPEEALPTS